MAAIKTEEAVAEPKALTDEASISQPFTMDRFFCELELSHVLARASCHVQDVERLAACRKQKRAALAEAQTALIRRHEKQLLIADVLQRNPALPRPVEALPPFQDSTHAAKGVAGDQNTESKAVRTINVKVLVTNDVQAAEYNFNGQTLDLSDLPISTTVMDLKQRLQPMLGLAPSKQKLTSTRLGVLKNSMTFAEYQMLDGENLSVGLKSRGK